MSDRLYLKTSEYAKLVGLHQRTIIKNFHKGLIPGYQDERTKTIYIENPERKQQEHNQQRTVLYARVSSLSNKASLDGQINRMRDYCAAKGYKIVSEVKEVGSGLNDHRRQLNKIFDRTDYDILLCEHPDRLTRFGYEYIERLLKRCGVKLEAINAVSRTRGTEEDMNDFISIVTSFCNRLYGRRRKDKTKQIIEDIKNE